MELTFAIPDELTAPLHEAFGDDLARAAVEQLALDGYRSGKLSRYQVQLLLGFDNRYDTENWLGDRAANQNYSLADLQADRATLDRVFPDDDMSLVVSDNSPLNLFVQIGQESVLPIMFGQILIPSEVVREMTHPKAPDIVRAFVSTLPPWLSVREPSHLQSFPTLDSGESAAISLAAELAVPLLIDERDGRSVAESLGVTVIGGIGVLERAADLGLIPDLRAVYNAIRTLRFHVAEAILAESLARHEKAHPRRQDV